MTFNFSEWKNNKYSVAIDIVFQDGKVFTKDYSDHFKYMARYKLGMALYTIKSDKVDKIINLLSDFDFCSFCIMDQLGVSKANNIT